LFMQLGNADLNALGMQAHQESLNRLQSLLTPERMILLDSLLIRVLKDQGLYTEYALYRTKNQNSGYS
jgi:hypothetical protein